MTRHFAIAALLCCTLGSANLPGQTLGPFAGELLRLPRIWHRAGFDHYYPDRCVKTGVVSFPRLNFLPRTTAEGFPGPGLDTLVDRFAFLLYSRLTVDSVGCHEFTLASDDGSRLWVADSLLINNDGEHKWTARRDSHHLAPGDYPVRVWYFNAYRPLMGLALRVRRLPATVDCRPRPTRVSLATASLFAFGSATVRPGAALDELVARLRPLAGGTVRVIGHTDGRGSADYNQRLSLRRATAVIAYLREELPATALTFVAEGRGATQPLGGPPQADRRVVVEW